MADTDILSKSITAGDYSETPNAGAFYFAFRNFAYNVAFPPNLDNLGLRESDYITSATIDHEALWAGAIAIAITKVSSLSWEIEGDIPLRNRRAQDLLLMADAGRGWVSFISKLLQDFLCTNNGAFCEIVRETENENSPIIGLIPLDSLRVIRTGNPDYPFTYQDLKGRFHNLRLCDVLEFADMPSSRANMYGSGKCGAYRAYKSIYKLANIEDYQSEKISGRNPSELNFITGVNANQLQAVLDTAQQHANAKGIIAYMGAIIAAVPGETSPQVGNIKLKGLPDNFDRKTELDIAILSYANNLGLDVQDLQPLTGQSLGSGAQSNVLNEKAKGKGLAAFRQQLMHALNTWVLPDRTTFNFVEKDWRDKIQEANYNKAVSEYVGANITSGVITAQQGLQVMVDENIYPKEFLAVDQTPDDNLADDEKPGGEVNPDPTVPVIPEPTIPEIIAKEYPLALEMVAKFKSLEEHSMTQITTKETVIPAVHIAFDPGSFVFNVPEQAAPIVNIPAPIINIPETVINIPAQTAPIVNVAAPIVNIPSQPAPIVNVAPKITVALPERKGDFVVRRDNFGNILGIEEK